VVVSAAKKTKKNFNYTMQSLHHFVLVGDGAGVDCDDLKRQQKQQQRHGNRNNYNINSDCNWKGDIQRTHISK